MRNLFLLIIGIMTMSCSTKHTFTATELALIGDSADAGSMRVLKTNNEADSLQLRKESQPLTAEDLKTETYAVLKARMLATVTDPENDGVGIAAPQVGIMRRLIAVQRYDKEGEPFEFYANPTIERYSVTKAIGSEGCLSVPNRSESVERSESIVLSYLDEATGKYAEEAIGGFTAVIFQHEVDHLDGVLYIDKVVEVPAETENDPEQ